MNTLQKILSDESLRKEIIVEMNDKCYPYEVYFREYLLREHFLLLINKDEFHSLLIDVFFDETIRDTWRWGGDKYDSDFYIMNEILTTGLKESIKVGLFHIKIKEFRKHEHIVNKYVKDTSLSFKEKVYRILEAFYVFLLWSSDKHQFFFFDDDLTKIHYRKAIPKKKRALQIALGKSFSKEQIKYIGYFREDLERM